MTYVHTKFADMSNAHRTYALMTLAHRTIAHTDSCARRIMPSVKIAHYDKCAHRQIRIFNYLLDSHIIFLYYLSI